MKPNLFAFATSELSQDAFIAWLLAWADPTHTQSDVPLHATAAQLLSQLLDLCCIPKPDVIRSVMVARQYKKIDVVVVVNGRIAIGIEDKVHTGEHSNQLQRYRAMLSDAFTAENVGAVYLKTGDQGRYLVVEQAGYVRFGRADFLQALRFGDGIGLRNDIVTDFRDNLERLDAEIQSFRSAALDDWKSRLRWSGFFVELQRHLRDTDWKYVSNKRGGFMGFWWYWKGNKYLQLEEGKLCFKIEVEDKARRHEEWEAWHQHLVTTSSIVGFELKRPKFQSGRYMTVAVSPQDYRRTNDNGFLDFDATLAVLRHAERLLETATEC